MFDERNAAALWTLRTAPLLTAFWLILSGKYGVLLLSLGALSITLVCWISWRADTGGHKGIPAAMLARTPRYFLWLGKEVLRSSLWVLRRIWTPHLTLRPVVDNTPAADMSALSQVTYANSITLTPGTLSMKLHDEHIEVHGLDATTIADLDTGDMARRVRRIEARE